MADRNTPAGRRLLPADEAIAYKILKKELPPQSIVLLKDMWRLSAVFVAVAVAASAATAAHGALGRTSGAAYLQLKDGYGFAAIRVRGNFFGRVGQGRIVSTANVERHGCERRKRLRNGLRLCRGQAITFATPTDSRWRVRLRGHEIAATGFVKGCLRLNARNSGSTGTFKIDGATRAWPRSLERYRLGTGDC